MTGTSLMTRTVCGVLAATRKRGYHTTGVGVSSLQVGGRPASAVPATLQSRVRSRWVGGFVVARMAPAVEVRGASARRLDTAAEAPAVAVIYLHGGAFINGIARQHWELAADLADAIDAPVHLPLYGRAPAHTAAESRQFLDAVLGDVSPPAPADGAADPVRVHLAGDSAGGNIALVTAQRHLGDPRIAGLTLIAPGLDLTMSNPELEVVEPTDPWLARPGLRPMMASWAGEEALDDPLVSPLYGPMSGLPPARLYIGTRDICWPDAKLLAERADREGWALSVRTDHGSPHVVPLLPTPEGRVARRDLLSWVAGNLS